MLNHIVILFYKYVKISNPEQTKLDQLSLCTSLNLKGRIIIAKEGINATLEGEAPSIEKYCKELLANELFKNTHIKKSVGTGNSFPKLIIKTRPEIVSAKLETDIDPNETTGKRLRPEDLQNWIENKKDFEIIDMRNDYEFKSGHFENAQFSGMKHFRDIKDVPEKLSHLKDKTVVAVCTGGVRCEKASGYLIKSGWSDVYQLDGGIVSYIEKYPNRAFKGTLYVFDNRITMNFDPPSEHEIVGSCEKCARPSENYINCSNEDCHTHFICCKNCLDRLGRGFCTPKCAFGRVAFTQSAVTNS